MEKTPRRDLKAATTGRPLDLLDAWQAARGLGASEVPHDLEDALPDFCLDWHYPRWRAFLRSEIAHVEQRFVPDLQAHLAAGGEVDLLLGQSDAFLREAIANMMEARIRSRAGRQRAWKALQVDDLFAELDTRLAVHRMGEF